MAFLALDRNGNGTIDSGAELFGNHTPLASGGVAANGFIALAQYDSNGDGVIDARDPIWSSLLLWIDWNDDGISEPGELTPISQSSVTSISLSYHWTGRPDPTGNVYRYQATCAIGSQNRPCYDIFFQRAP